jgi:hypothetical protein
MEKRDAKHESVSSQVEANSTTNHDDHRCPKDRSELGIRWPWRFALVSIAWAVTLILNAVYWPWSRDPLLSVIVEFPLGLCALVGGNEFLAIFLIPIAWLLYVILTAVLLFFRNRFLFWTLYFFLVLLFAENVAVMVEWPKGFRGF